MLNAIAKLFKAICLKDIISEFIWLSLAGSLSILVSYTFFLQQKCRTDTSKLMQNAGKVYEKVEDNVDPVIEQTKKDIEKRANKTASKLDEKIDETFVTLNDNRKSQKSFNKKFKSEEFWLGQQYKSSLELGDYNKNISKENAAIKNRMIDQGEVFLENSR